MGVRDVDDVVSIETRAYEHPWTRGIFEDCLRVGYCAWVCADASRIMGYGLMSVAVGEAHLLNLAVDPQHQGRRMGSRLLTHLLHLAPRHGAEVVFLEVRPSNHGAIALYRKFGFHEVGFRRDYYPARHGREDALLLARQLFAES
jgi:ribosomal-protein-alanine N-acetyltransferase